MKQFILCLVVLSSSLAQARSWSEYTSQNFILQTDASSKKARRILSNFETFHTVVIFVTGVGLPDGREPVVIVMYDTKKDFRAIGHSDDIAGYYHNTEEGPRMVVGPRIGGMRRSQQTILFHEYVHYLMFNYSDFDYPRWFSEGLADLLSGTRIEKNQITLGVTPGYRGNWLKVEGTLDLAELLAPNVGSKTAFWNSQFYATAWLLTHYLKISPFSGNTELISQSREYLRLYNERGDSISAFEESFGTRLDVMDVRLTAYFRERGLTVLEMDRPAVDVEISRRKLTTDEAAYILGHSAYESGKYEAALNYLDKAEAKNSGAARALILKALLINRQGDFDEGRNLREIAMGFAPNDAYVLASIAHIEWEEYVLLSQGLDDPSSLDSNLDRVIEYSQKAIKINSLNRGAYQWLWLAHMERDEELDALKAMMAVYQMDPSNISLSLTIGSYLGSLDKPTLARPFLERVKNFSHHNPERQTAGLILEAISKGKVND